VGRGRCSGRVWAEGDAAGSCANVPRPAASSSIWQNLKSILRYPLHRPRRRASVVCVFPVPTLRARSGCWGAQRSGIKEESEGRGTAAELSAPAARSSPRTQRSGIKGESAGRGTAAELSAPAARSSPRNQRSGIKEESEGRGTAAELSAPVARSPDILNGVWPVIISGKIHGRRCRFLPVPATCTGSKKYPFDFHLTS